VSRYPLPPYPNGWFRVAFSNEVLAGQVKPVRYFGNELVVFRGWDGVAHVVDAYCAHLGAHLGKGGKVVENTLQCPFHGWRYDGDGQCVAVPFAKKVPSRARVRSWLSREVNGTIFAWYHAEGKEPAYEIPELAEYSSGHCHQGQIGRQIGTHIQEAHENMADVVHLAFLHHGLDYPKHFEWREYGDYGEVVLRSITRFWRFSTDSTIKFDIHGPGFQVVRIDATIQFLALFTISPVEEEKIDFQIMVLFKRMKFPPASFILHRIMLHRVMAEILEDKPIWESKKYHVKPMLSDADGPILKFRQWLSHFYSPTLSANSGASKEPQAEDGETTRSAAG
jgi:phenylpropionate dioxygenase-like ring-hydroxylating dioxygenase large terminal subunit